MKTIFDDVTIGGLHLKNRLIRSATVEIGGAKDGKSTPLLNHVLEELADGGIGLIITGMMGVAPGACIAIGLTKIYDDDFIERLSRIVKNVHRRNCLIIVQLGHCGAKSDDLDGDDYPYAPSDVEMLHAKARAMTVEQINDLAKSYGVAALKCKEAGADGVQIHAAHGYLLNQFLSPLYNRRTDDYGGSIEGRAKFLFQVYDEIRKQVGNDYPVWVKINYTDLVEGGVTESDVQWYCRELDRRGIDAIEVSAGICMDKSNWATQFGRTDEGFNADYALRLADKVNTAVISVGGFRSPKAMNEALNRGNIAAVSLCRALIREPDLPRHWMNGENKESTCISCDQCYVSKTHGCFLDQHAE